MTARARRSRSLSERSPALIPDDFPETGFYAARQPAQQITRFQVVGERSSGTNFVSRLLGRNSGLRGSGVLGWKHGFPRPKPIPADLAVICTVRRADKWALSMHAKPWHTVPALQSLEFGDFIRAPWETVFEHGKYFPGAKKAGIIGQPLTFDRHPDTGAAYDNLFALRRAKLAAMLGYLDRDCMCVLICMETAQLAPEATLDALYAVLGLPPRSAAYKPVKKRLGSKFTPAIADRPDTPKRMGSKGMTFMRGQIDTELEARLGYVYG